MIGIIFGIILATIFFIWFVKHYSAEIGAVAPVAAATLLVLSWLIVDGMFAIFSPDYIEVKETCEIVASQEIIALQDNSDIQGSFFLGSGSINNRDYYVYYYKTEYGYKQNKLYLDNDWTPVYLHYIPQGGTPHIDQYALVEHTTLIKKPSIWLSLIEYLQYKDMEIGETISEIKSMGSLFITDPSVYDNYRIEIHIPEGSIKEGYIIDLE